MPRFTHTLIGLATAGVTVLAGQITTTAPQVASAAADADPALTAAIDTLLDDPRLDGSLVAVQVRDAETGEVLYDRNGRDADARSPPTPSCSPRPRPSTGWARTTGSAPSCSAAR